MKESKVFNLFKNNIDSIILFVFIGVIYAYIYWFCNSDLGQHVVIAINKYENAELLSGNFLLYLLIHVFSLFTRDTGLMKIVICVLLAMATTWRYWLAKDSFKDIDERKRILLSISLIFVFIIPILAFKDSILYSNWYLDYLVPNVWHNSTTIFLFPFALLLFFKSLEVLQGRLDNKIILQMMILIFCNVFIKPSFFFVFCIAYPILVLHKYKFSRLFLKGILPIIFGFVCLLVVYLTIYSNSSDGSFVYLDFRTLFTIVFWKNHFGYMLLSVLFPILITCIYRKQMIKEYEFWMCTIMLIVAIGIFFICKEGGPRAMHGNFYWQIVISMWLYFYYSLKVIIKSFILYKSKKDIICLSIYSIHVIFGILYLLRYMLTHNYA